MRKTTRPHPRSASSSNRPHRSRKHRRIDVLLPRRRIRDLARSTGFSQRAARKCPPVAFLTTLVFGFGVEVKRSMAALTRFFTTVTKESLARSAFQKKFSDASVAFLRAIFREATTRAAASMGTDIGGKLRHFRDISVFDATVVRLHRFLADRFPGCRTNHSPATVKLQTVLCLSKRVVSHLAITAGRVSDADFVKRFQVTVGQLLLFDLGYYASAFFQHIDATGAFFVSRLKDNANPYIVRVRRGVARGYATKNKRLKDIQFAWERPIDLDVRLTLAGPVFRVVGTWNAEKGWWHLYVTNLPVRAFSVEEIALVYRLRWEVELLFKELKSTCRLDHVHTRREEVVLSLFYASLLSLLVSRTLARAIEAQRVVTALKLSYRIVTSYLIQQATALAIAFFRGGRSLGLRLYQVMDDIARTCQDPNPKRPSTLARLCR
jgi:putative transposase